MDPEQTIPEQQDGTAVDVEDSVSHASDAEAKRFFATVKSRLLDVNHWKEWAGTLSAGFHLTDAGGNEINDRPKAGHYFKINIPAPGIGTGEGYDWVRIEDVREEAGNESEFVAIRVRPAPSPVNANKDVAHFYTDEATSNFIVRRDGATVTAGVYGRNEKPNIEKADSLLDKVRNAVVGTGGVAIASKLQWKALVSGLLSPCPPEGET